MTKEPTVFWNLRQFNSVVEGNTVTVNASVSIPIDGRMTCIVGPNGGGKSSLIKLFAGVIDRSKFKLFGVAEIQLNHANGKICENMCKVKGWPRAFKDLNVVYVSQELLSVNYSNWDDALVSGSEGKWYTKVDHKKNRTNVLKLARLIGITLKLDNKLIERPVRATYQKIVLLKSLLRLNQHSIVILDEATSSLKDDESIRVFEYFEKKLKNAEILGVVYVSHRNVEIQRAEQIIRVQNQTILKLDSNLVKAEESYKNDTGVLTNDICFEMENVRTGQNAIENIILRRGQITHIQFESAQEELDFQDSLISVDMGGDRISILGTDVTNMSLKKRRRLGLRIVPLDRNAAGIFGDLTAMENIAIGETYSNKRSLSIDNKKTEKQATQFNVHGKMLTRQAKKLSGGEKQRLLFARELNEGAQIFVAFNPFQGIDPGIREQLRGHLKSFASDGGAVLLVGTE